MKHIICSMALGLLCVLELLPETFGQPATNATQTDPRPVSSSGPADIRDSKISEIVRSIETALAPSRGYTAEVESQSLDPNGGFDRFQDEQTVRCPDRMLVKRKVLAAHNADTVGDRVTQLIDGTWLVTCTEKPRSAEQRRRFEEMAARSSNGRVRTKEEMDQHMARLFGDSYSKVNLQAVAQAGGPSVREYVAMTGNLADPLGAYKLDTLKLETENRTEWVLLAEYKQPGAPWPRNRLTIDKKTAFLKKVEAVIPELDHPVVLLRVKNVTRKAEIENSLFKLELPASNSLGSPYVSDNTKMWIDGIEMRRTAAEQNGKSETLRK